MANIVNKTTFYLKRCFILIQKLNFENKGHRQPN